MSEAGPTEEEKKACAVQAAAFQQMMQTRWHHRFWLTVFVLAFSLFVSVFPLGSVLFVSHIICGSEMEGALARHKVDRVCPLSDAGDFHTHHYSHQHAPDAVDHPHAEGAEHPKRKKVTTTSSTPPAQTGKAVITDTEKALDRLRARTWHLTPQDELDRLAAIKTLQAEVDAHRKRELEKTQKFVPLTELQQHRHFKNVAFFLSMAIAFLVWFAVTSIAQLSVVNRHWKSTSRVNSDWAASASIFLQAPTIIVAVFVIGLWFYLTTFVAPNLDLPGVLDKDGFPVRWFWMLVATAMSSMIFVTTLGMFCYAHNFPWAAEAHEIRRALSNTKREIEERVEPPEEKISTTWHNLLKYGLDFADAKKNAPNTPSRHKADFPNVTIYHTAADALSAIKSLCMVLGITMIVTLIFVELGFDVLVGELKETGELREAIIASGNAWILSLGVGMSVSLFMIYIYANARLAPYVDDSEPKADTQNAWSLKGKILNPILPRENISLTATPEKDEDKEDVITYSDALAMGANQQKIDAILERCVRGGGVHAALNSNLLKQVAQVLSLLAPALASGVLTFLN